MESNRGAVIAWTAGVCGGAAALAAVFAAFTGRGWRIAAFVLAAVAACALLVLIGIGFRPASLWLKEAWQQRRQRKEPPRRVITDRWRYTSAAFDVGMLANLGQKGFSHAVHLRSAEDKPPAVRFGVFVACGLLADDEPTAEHLRSCMRDCLSQPEFMGLIGMLTGVDAGAEWHSQPGRGRFNLEADLLGPLGSGKVFASALLLLPERGIMGYGEDSAGAELYLHVDLPMKNGAPVRAQLAQWHDRFIAALGLPGLLSRFLDSVGLVTSGDPAARFAIQLQARSQAAIGLDEIVDFGNLAVLSPRKYSVQFDGWAVADEQGKAAGAISRRFLTELCESTGRTGYEGIVADLADAKAQSTDFRPNDRRRRRRPKLLALLAAGIIAIAAGTAAGIDLTGGKPSAGQRPGVPHTSARQSPASGNTGSAHSPVAVTAPTAPTHVAAAALDQYTIRVTWTDNMTGVTGFDISNGCGADGCSGGALNVRTGPVTAVDVATTPGAYQCFYVTALNKAGASTSPHPGCTSTPGIDIPITQEWTDTGVTVPAGAAVGITATGAVYLSGASSSQGPGGDPSCTPAADYPADSSRFPAPQLPCWSLIARIGNGRPFEVGTSILVTATAGRLYLGVNAESFSSNTGIWAVKIKIGGLP